MEGRSPYFHCKPRSREFWQRNGRAGLRPPPSSLTLRLRAYGASHRAAAKLASSDRRLSYYRGVALVLEKKDPATAEYNLRTYIDTVPDNSEVPLHSSAYEWHGRLCETEKRPDLVAKQYQAALALDPQNKTLRGGVEGAAKEELSFAQSRVDGVRGNQRRPQPNGWQTRKD